MQHHARKMKSCYRVNVVVDAAFGTRLLDLPGNEPVWIAETPGNADAIRTARMLRVGTNHLSGVTSFRFDPTDDPAALLLELLPVIDEHHGGQIPPFDALRFFGSADAETLRDELLRMGFPFQESGESFVEFTREESGTALTLCGERGRPACS